MGRKIRIVRERMVADENGELRPVVVEDYYEDVPDPTPEQIREYRVAALERAMNEIRGILDGKDYYNFYISSRDVRQEYLDLLPTFEMWLRGAKDEDYGIDFTTTGFPSKPYFTSELLNAILTQLDESTLMGF